MKKQLCSCFSCYSAQTFSTKCPAECGAVVQDTYNTVHLCVLLTIAISMCLVSGHYMYQLFVKNYAEGAEGESIEYQQRFCKSHLSCLLIQYSTITADAIRFP